MSGASNYNDFEVIVGEIGRLHKKFIVEKDFSEPEDALYGIKHPSGGGSMVIGRLAAQKFIDISRRAIEGTPDISQRVSVSSVEAAIRYNFREKVLIQKKILSRALSDKIISSSIRHIKLTKLRTLRHNFPCLLPLDKECEEFYIGPIRFRTTQKFLIEKHAAFELYDDRCFKKYLSEFKPSARRDILPQELEAISQDSRSFTKEVKQYISEFPWVMEVTVSNFENKKSQEISRIAAALVLNIVKLFLSPLNAEEIRLAGESRSEMKGVDLIEDESSALDLSTSRKFATAERTGWISKVVSTESLQMAGSLIPHLLSGENLPLIYQRIINGLAWYGSSLSQDSPYLKITSLSNAIEAVLSTTNNDISENVCWRGSKLISFDGDVSWETRITNFYSLRSGLVHGRIAAYDARVSRGLREGQMISQKILLEALIWTRYMADKNCFNGIGNIHSLFESDLEDFCSGKVDNVRILNE